MKKSLSIILTLIITLTAFVFPVNASATVIKPHCENNTLYCSGKTIFYTNDGIYVLDKNSDNAKKIVSKSNIFSMISNGKTIIFSRIKDYNTYIDENNSSEIYSVSVTGTKLKKLKTVKKSCYLKIGAKYNNYIYFFSGLAHYMSNLYKLDTNTKKVTLIKKGLREGYCIGNNLYSLRNHSDLSEETTYKVNLKTGKYKKVYNDAPFGFAQHPYYYKREIYSDYSGVKVKTLYYSTDGNKYKKSHAINKTGYIVAVDAKNNFAILSNKSFYRIDLKTGKKTKIIKYNENVDYHFRTDSKTGKVYVLYDKNNKTYVRLVTKTNLGEKQSFSINPDCYIETIVNGKLISIVDNQYSIFKIK